MELAPPPLPSALPFTVLPSKAVVVSEVDSLVPEDEVDSSEVLVKPFDATLVVELTTWLGTALPVEESLLPPVAPRLATSANKRDTSLATAPKLMLPLRLALKQEVLPL